MSTEDRLKLYSCPWSVLMARVSSAGLRHMVSISWQSAWVISLLFGSGRIWRKSKHTHYHLETYTKLTVSLWPRSEPLPLSPCSSGSCPPLSFQRDKQCLDPWSTQSPWSRTRWLWCEKQSRPHLPQYLWSSSSPLACTIWIKCIRGSFYISLNSWC